MRRASTGWAPVSLRDVRGSAFAPGRRAPGATGSPAVVKNLRRAALDLSVRPAHV